MSTKLFVTLTPLLVAGVVFAQPSPASVGDKPIDKPSVLSPAFVERANQGSATPGAEKGAVTPDSKLTTGPRSVNPLTGSPLAMEVRRQQLAELDLDVQIEQKRKALRDLRGGPALPVSAARASSGPGSPLATAPARAAQRARSAPPTRTSLPAINVASPTPPLAPTPPSAPRLVAISAGRQGPVAVVELPGRPTVVARANTQHADLRVGEVGTNFAVLNGRRIDVTGEGTIMAPSGSSSASTRVAPTAAPSPIPVSGAYFPPAIGAPVPPSPAVPAVGAPR